MDGNFHLPLLIDLPDLLSFPRIRHEEYASARVQPQQAAVVVVVIFIGDETVYSFFRTTADAYVEIRLSQNRQSYRGRQGHFTAKKITATTKAFES